MKKILFAASECVPFIKTGGLADVAGALPKEFDKNEWKKSLLQEHCQNNIDFKMYLYERII